MKKNNNVIMHARSKETGIVFYSNYYPKVGIEAYKEKGNIYTRIIYTSLDEYIFIYKDKSGKQRKIVITIMDLIIILIAIISRSIPNILATTYFIVNCSTDFVNFIYMSYYMKSSKKKDFARYHAAEHKACSAYDKYRRLPTMDEIKKESRFSKYCGSIEVSKNIIFSVGYCLSTYLLLSREKYVLFCIAMLIISIVSITFKKYMQIFVTSPPRDDDIELAREGISAFIELENKIKNGANIYIDGGWDQIKIMGFKLDE